MRNAPSVMYPVGRCAFQAWLQSFVGFICVTACVTLLRETSFQAILPWQWHLQAVLVLGLLIWVAWAVRSWLVSPQGTLHWQPAQAISDGRVGAWSWNDQDSAEPLLLVEVERVLDLQDWMLLRASWTKGARRWFWVERLRSPARWGDLRRALVSGQS